jgi:hypothetical protein
MNDVLIVNFYMADYINPNGGKSVYKKCGTAGHIAPEIFK